jgi:arylsulfate sulfotransferase
MATPSNLAGFSSSVTTTNNTLVAKYTLTAPAGSTVSVEFGLDTTYGRATWSVAAPSGGGPVSILVAGMYANSLYHMRALVDLGGVIFPDKDQTFQTGAVPLADLPLLNANSFGTPSPGVELVNANPSSVCVSDLQGQFIWYYFNQNDAKYYGDPLPLKPLANGNYMALVTNRYSNKPITAPYGVLREFDLAGDTIREIDLPTLNQKLLNMKTPFGRAVKADFYSHDFWNMSNGYVVVIVQELVQVKGVQGGVWGDNLIVLDDTFTPVWVWSTFDVLDINRRSPLWNPDNDWTHCNAIQETPDGNFLLSVRNQSWVLKIDYAGGTGNLQWTLGYEGDFQLQNSTSTDDWFAAQHFPHILTTSGSNITALTIMDNGNDRVPPVSAPYSRGIVMQIDETSNPKTAQVVWQWPAPPSTLYSYWGGSVVRLANGNMEICMSYPYPAQAPPLSFVVEVDPVNQNMIWEMIVTPADAYRSYRIPSLYPGVQW